MIYVLSIFSYFYLRKMYFWLDKFPVISFQFYSGTLKIKKNQSPRFLQSTFLAAVARLKQLERYTWSLYPAISNCKSDLNLINYQTSHHFKLLYSNRLTNVDNRQ